jgi:hypothetical protein
VAQRVALGGFVTVGVGDVGLQHMQPPLVHAGGAGGLGMAGGVRRIAGFEGEAAEEQVAFDVIGRA